MAAGDACRSCRRGRCPACCCVECGVEPVDVSAFASAVGEHGPELVGFRGDETVLKAGD
jgi:hypothetical protein